MTWLSGRARERLAERARHAAAHAKVGEPVLVSVCERLDGEHDPSGIVLAARGPDQRFTLFEQPERDRRALATLDAALTLNASGEGRLTQLARQWRAVSAQALADEGGGPAGSGLAASVAFAFDAHGAASEPWRAFANSTLTVPVISLARTGGECWLTLNLLVARGQPVSDTLASAQSALSRLDSAVPPAPPMGLAGPARPALIARRAVRSTLAPAHYTAAVREACRRIARGQLEKVVLAREVQAGNAGALAPAAIIAALRERYGSCFIYANGCGDDCFLGATPELLVRREGHRAVTVALAGSIARDPDPERDRQLGARLLASAKDRHENAVVARRIARALAPLSVWVTQAREPMLVTVANIQHLCTPLRAQLADEVGLLELAAALHPTPAVGGEPNAVATALIDELEDLDRGLYAGAQGWLDIAGDGELCVTLRCALLHDAQIRCFAGAGIVADSDPDSELAETETKLGAMLGLLCEPADAEVQ